MFRNIMAFLFLITLALPAVAMGQPAQAQTHEVSVASDCHGTPIPMTGHDAPAQDNSDMRLHGCIGCIAPTASAYIVPTYNAPSPDEAIGSERALTGTFARPTIPPPRA
jgi:hypothetical protein